jgi:hypothetical protein
MLHIHNGDCSANIAKQSSLTGEHFAWRESLITGPTPSGLSGNEWRKVRAQHLSGSYGVDLRECERGLLDQEKKLESFREHEEVVLWFEHDLFCQTNLVYLLNWFGQQDLGPTKLSLICINEFPGKENFRGLGELNAPEMASLFPGRQQVTSQELNLAATAWQAYCSTNPTAIETFLQTDTSSLPFLKAALHAHLRRFPSIKNGLGRIESKSLELIDSGSKSFMDAFPRFGNTESIYGLGDAQFWLALQRMGRAKNPLLEIRTEKNGEHGEQELTPNVARETEFEITEIGKSVLKGEADFVALNGIDLWLGGVHLHHENNLWRWDERSERIVSA